MRRLQCGARLTSEIRAGYQQDVVTGAIVVWGHCCHPLAGSRMSDRLRSQLGAHLRDNDAVPAGFDRANDDASAVCEFDQLAWARYVGQPDGSDDRLLVNDQTNERWHLVSHGRPKASAFKGTSGGPR